MRENLVIIGNGMAPGRMLEHLLEADPERYAITIFNAEPRVNYNRLMLSPVLSGDKTYEDIVTHDEQWYENHNITLHRNAPVHHIDVDNRQVHCSTTGNQAYDKLVIATGSIPIMIPIPGKDLPGVSVYRDLDDVERMLKVSTQGGRAVVIGGGLLGLEAAAGLKQQGMDVCVVHLCEHLMEKQLDSSASFLLKQEFEKRGITVLTSTSTSEILGDSHVTGVRFEDGAEIDCDLLVMAVGIRPSTQLALDAGIAVNRGIVVDDTMQTSANDVYALGECVEHRSQCFGLVAPLYEMSKVLASTLLNEDAAFKSSATATQLKVNGVNLYSAGLFEELASPQSSSADSHAQDGLEEIVLRDATAGVYKRLILDKEHIAGVVLYGDTEDGAWYFDMLKRKVDVSELRDTLIFGQAYQGGAELDPTAAVAALPDDAEICGCNGVCKGTITHAISSLSLTTLDEVRAHTKASSSCGTCSTLVERIMQVSLGELYNPLAVTPVCGCTDLGHDEVRSRIRVEKLTSINAVLQALEWRSSCGCAKCRPALNYYLVCEWPELYKDDYQSRFINERAHANIQKDGTYSVVPRMWGGMTSSKELRALADVVDKFDIPAVKVTGGQRIDLLGVEKTDLLGVWSDLGKAGFVSGHAYSKGLRTVKTCVGKQWCRFGTQDSTELGIRLEHYLWGSWTPAKVKLGVSGCPRNCAEATCKDIGVICVDSGFELHFAGAAGLDIQGTQVLGHVSNEDDVVDHIAALLQMYREQGHYLERIYKWAKRVGVEEIRSQIMEDEHKRAAYHERFKISQRVAQVDPWAERVEGRDAHEFSELRPKPVQEVA
ncbi:MAG: nitrite reductase large subunit NirB [Granulosicoccus sp.]